ncbi:hypothetical protein A0J61_01232 [Choanephora cucurbitarum]|uniref:Uncharacterized protein n=1 Tax=Choanephora cucurbitarum TaxID=101091 RepID=A0A1C7NNP1_9FUNG|nr:hypothetical protein A0J61_01232 [Choanephora cucurbitarum]
MSIAQTAILKSHSLSDVEPLSHCTEDEKNHTLFSEKKSKRWFIIRKITYIVVVNAALPITLYCLLKSYMPAVWALVLSSTPTILSVVLQVIFARKIDSIGFGVSIVLASINQDPKMLLMRESFVTAAIGVVCSLTLIPIRYKLFELKPVLYYIAKDLIPLEPIEVADKERPSQNRMEFYWQHSSYCRFHFRILTIIDMLILELEFGLKLYYILNFDIDTVVILSNLTLSVIGIVCFLLTIAYIMHIRRHLKEDEPMLIEQAELCKAALNSSKEVDA